MAHEGIIKHDETEPNSFVLYLVIIISLAAIAFVVAASLFYYNTSVSEVLNRKQETGVPTDLQKLRLYEQERLTRLSYDKSRNKYIIPIDMAMDAVLRENSK